MQVVQVRLNPELTWQNSIQQEAECIHQQIELTFNEGSSEVLQLEHNIT
jgi:hypothetical protein